MSKDSKKQVIGVLLESAFGNNVPQKCGLWLMGEPFVVFGSVAVMEEVFVTKN